MENGVLRFCKKFSKLFNGVFGFCVLFLKIPENAIKLGKRLNFTFYRTLRPKTSRKENLRFKWYFWILLPVNNPKIPTLRRVYFFPLKHLFTWRMYTAIQRILFWKNLKKLRAYFHYLLFSFFDCILMFSINIIA